MAMTLGSAVFILIDGQLVSQHTQFSIEQKNNSTPMKSVALGFNGMTPGADMAEVSFDLNTPVDDLELNPTPKIRANAVIEIGVIVSGRQSVAAGFFTGQTIKGGVDQNTVQTITGVFKMADFE